MPARTANSSVLAGTRRPVSQTLCRATATSAAHGSRANPVDRRSIAAQPPADAADAGDGSGDCRNREQHAAFREHLEIVVVRVVEKRFVRRRLVDDHGALERPRADAGQPEILRHRPGGPPDGGAAADSADRFPDSSGRRQSCSQTQRGDARRRQSRRAARRGRDAPFARSTTATASRIRPAAAIRPDRDRPTTSPAAIAACRRRQPHRACCRMRQEADERTGVPAPDGRECSRAIR